MGENPQDDCYTAYPRLGKKTIIGRQAMLMMIILDCKEFDRLFDSCSTQIQKLEQKCQSELARFRQDPQWNDDKKVKSNTKLPFIFHWYFCTFGSFWGSINLS